MRNRWMPLILVTIIVTGCQFQCSVGDTPAASKEVSSSESTGPMIGATVLNDIDLDATGVKVSQSYLTDDNGNQLTQNEVKEGEKIRCVVRLDTGWTKYDGKSFIGASEKVITGSGKVALDEPDLFAAYAESGVNATDAKVLTVTAVITKKEPGVDDYKAQFRMWDKRGSGEVTGSFKFKVK